MRWQQSDLDFPVLMLEADAGPASVFTYGSGPWPGLISVGIRYGEEGDELHLQTLVRRGRRMGSHGPHWVADELGAQAGEAARNLMLSTIENGMLPQVRQQRVHEHVAAGQRLAGQFPGEP